MRHSPLTVPTFDFASCRQYDMPVMKGGVADPETYLHRVGRTGRFGRKGVALNLIHDEKEMKVLKQIEVTTCCTKLWEYLLAVTARSLLAPCSLPTPY